MRMVTSETEGKEPRHIKMKRMTCCQTVMRAKRTEFSPLLKSSRSISHFSGQDIELTLLNDKSAHIIDDSV